MTDKIRKDSGDSYANWEDVKCDRQSYANAHVRKLQREGGYSFEALLFAFRAAGEEFDRWTEERSREIAA